MLLLLSTAHSATEQVQIVKEIKSCDFWQASIFKAFYIFLLIPSTSASLKAISFLYSEHTLATN